MIKNKKTAIKLKSPRRQVISKKDECMPSQIVILA